LSSGLRRADTETLRASCNEDALYRAGTVGYGLAFHEL